MLGRIVALIGGDKQLALGLSGAALLALLWGAILFLSRPSPQPSGVLIGATTSPAGGFGAVDLKVQRIGEGGGVAAIQGGISYGPRLIAIERVVGRNGFIVAAVKIDNNAGLLRFALVSVGNEGVSDGSVGRIVFHASSSPGKRARLVWSTTPEAALVVGGNDNDELTEVKWIDGYVQIR